MRIESVSLKGYRNFRDTKVVLGSKALVIGPNDAGKTNFIYALRLLLDRSLSEQEIEPCESDFHISATGEVSKNFQIIIVFCDVKQDAVLSILAGDVGEDARTVFRFTANRETLQYTLEVGREEKYLREVTSRFYLRHLNLKVVDARRDLGKFIQSEKRNLLKIAQELRTSAEVESDGRVLSEVERTLTKLNELVTELNYVSSATNDVNEELKSLAYHHINYSVRLNSVAVDVSQFVEKLELAGATGGSKVMLGGDGRNNQILLALWKAKSLREFDAESEVVIYCVEEPEAHLHPHQQRRLADYLSKHLLGQTIVTTHSPQILSGYTPEFIVRLKTHKGNTWAASGGCSNCISSAWDSMGYRMSILPAEAFFSTVVFLVEGPSELLFYRQLAEKIGIDLDYYNISILSVDGVQFEVYAQILRAMEIPFVLRTDNDVSKISIGPIGEKVEYRQLAGLNRCLALAGRASLQHRHIGYTQRDSVMDGTWAAVSKEVNPYGIFISMYDLETDLGFELPAEYLMFRGPDVHHTVAYLKEQKAVRMREFLKQHGSALSGRVGGELAKPLQLCVKIAIDELTV